jgi:hypothetical protein
MVAVRENLIGKVFGKLKVIDRADDYISPSGKRKARWLCECDCIDKNKVIVNQDNLKSGHTLSCGCYKIEHNIEIHQKHNKYDLSGEYGIGWTFNTNKEFYFDLEDYDLIYPYCWYEKEDGAIVCKRQNIIYMHRLVMNVSDDMQVDHIYHCRNDNRKQQLRIANNTQNTINRGIQHNNTSGCTGVSWNKQYNKWHSYISIYNKRITLGYFDNLNDAIMARKRAEEEYFGEWRYKEEKLF